MSKATQENRLLSIATSLPYDTLLIDYFEGEEGISQLFRFRLEVLVEESNERQFDFSPIDVTKILGQKASICVDQKDKNERTVAKRYFTGILNSWELMGRQFDYTRYQMYLVPAVWKLTKTFRSRIFQHMSVPDILRDIFGDYETKFQLSRSHNVRNICVQYQESDFDFASRIMEEEGIYYYFEHSSETERMIFRDKYDQPQDCPMKNRLGIVDITEGVQGVWEPSIQDIWMRYQLDSGKYVFWDYNFQLPTQRLDVEKKSRFNIGGNQKLEVYKYPGGYANRFDGINKGGGDDPDALQQIFQDNQQTASNAVANNDIQYYNLLGESDCCTLTAGYRFTLEKHRVSSLNQKYVLLSVKHESSQNPGYKLGDTTERKDYRNSFASIPHGSGHPEYRPPIKTPKPVVRGSQTAFVVGPEEIFTDEYGRVKVQFPWDRDGKFNSDSYCWVRVGQMWASNKWGSMFIPRRGMEVIVDFINGDPNEPIITGCVYNPEAMPAYRLPDEKTKSYIKTDSSPGGGGFNEVRFEDDKGKEQIFVRGEKDLDIRVLNDTKETVENDRHLIVKNNQLEKVTRDKSLSVGGDHKENVTGTVSRKAGRDLHEKVGMNYSLQAGIETHIKAGLTSVVEAGTSMTLKVGGNFININPAGIFIKGTMVMINSGGASMSGTACQPDSPADPKEADEAQAGTTIKAQEAGSPPDYSTYSPSGKAMWNASQRGTPFVAV